MNHPTVVRIDLSRCINCSLCRRACPSEAIKFFSTGHRTHIVAPEWCIGCDICVPLCPVDCIEEDPAYVIDPVQLEVARDRARAWAHRQRRIKVARRERAVSAARSTVATG